MKTAMQELFNTIHSGNFTLTDAWEWLMNNENVLLEKEKDQIQTAYFEGISTGTSAPKGEIWPSSATYYKNTYEAQ